MVHPYLNRRAGREPVVYPHASLEPILRRTLGVPLFQEQLLRLAMVAAGFTGGQAEELRRAFGFKRSERRMQQIEVQLREGMARKGITGQACEDIIKSITSFALYGFPESHAASFALLVYASAYLKAHFPAAFYAGLLNNQPMGFYHPATLVKDAQRRGVRFAPIDAQRSDWLCAIEPDGSVRLGLCYVNGLRREVGQAMARGGIAKGSGIGDRGTTVVARGIRLQPDLTPDTGHRTPDLVCPKCGCDDRSLVESSVDGPVTTFFCNNCAHDWKQSARNRRFASVDDLIATTGINREELSTLAEIGALNSFGYDRREALWQVERAIRPAGELFADDSPAVGAELAPPEHIAPGTRAPSTRHSAPSTDSSCPLSPMTPVERIAADYSGTSLTIGPHPMAMRRREMALRGVLRAIDLPRERDGRRVRVAGAVITRQRPGTAKGFVFLTLEDETGIANIIVRPDLFARERLTVIEERFLLVEGRLQNQDGITSVRAERFEPLPGARIDVESHDFY
jgi:error-prone DNA polymerase